MRLFKTSTYTVTRFTRKILQAGGKFSDGTTSTFDIEANKQPLSGRQLKILPEGNTADDALSLYTKTKLNTSSQFSKEQADEIDVNGLTYKCFDVAEWDTYSLIPDHYECMFIRKDQAS